MALKGVTVDGVDYQFDYRYLANRPLSVASVTIGLPWSGNSEPYSNVVTIQGVTANTKVDLQPNAAVLAQMASDGVTALWIENDNGTLTAKSMGAWPTAALTMQCTLTEVG